MRKVTEGGDIKTHMRHSSIKPRLRVLQLVAKLHRHAAFRGQSCGARGTIDLFEASESLEKIMSREGRKFGSSTLRYLWNWSAANSLERELRNVECCMIRKFSCQLFTMQGPVLSRSTYIRWLLGAADK